MIDLVAYYAKRNDKALEGGFGGLDSLRFFFGLQSVTTNILIIYAL